MSGHSKWHNIQKTKGAQDAKRAAAFTKISKEMIVAVKEGGGVADPAYNSRLATVITKAKAANMPNDNIKRVLEKAASAGQGDSYEAITYEGHGPSGIAVIVETMTDNRNRTAGQHPPSFRQIRRQPRRQWLRQLGVRQKGRHRDRQRGRRAGRGCRDDGRARRGRRRLPAGRGLLHRLYRPQRLQRRRQGARGQRATSSSPRRSRWSRRTIRSSISPKISPTWKKCSTSSRMMTTSRTSGITGNRE